MEKISVIIPVYNSEQYIGNCLEMLQNQSYRDYKVICVDDGSTDRSSEIIQQFSKTDSRIEYYFQQNKGAGSARNYGMKYAFGKYILFLDADDTYEKDLLLTSVDLAESNDADIVVFNADKFDAMSNEKNKSWSAIRFVPLNKEVFSAKEIKEFIFNFTVPAVWNKLFKRSFIEREKLHFQEIKSTNDLFFSYAALSEGQKITVIDTKLIHYRTNNIYSIQGNNKKNIFDAFDALIKLQNYLKEHNIYTVYEQSYIKMASDIIVYTLARADGDQFRRIIADTFVRQYIYNTFSKCNAQIHHIPNGNIMIYGAGVLAQVFVRYVTEFLKIDKEKLLILVSDDKLNNDGEICGIPIQYIGSIRNFISNTVYICASNEKSRMEMIRMAEGYKLTKTECVSDVEIIGILFDCIDNKK